MNYLERITDKERQLSALIKRMDEDVLLYYLSPYKMMDDTGKKRISGSVSVTLNRTGVLAWNVIAGMGRASEQVIVESEGKRVDTHYVEDFVKAAFASANAQRVARGGWPLNPYADEQVCIRGGCARKVLFQDNEKGIFTPEITPWDIRYVTYEVGGEGLEWAAYKTLRSKELVEAEYANIPKLGGGTRSVTVSGKEAEVIDVWDREHNEVWIDKKLEFEQPHSFGFCPVVIEKVTLGSMLADRNSLSHGGESIFFLIRGIAPELNRLASIMQTLNLLSVKGPQQYSPGGGAPGETPEYDEALSPGAMTNVGTGGRIGPIDFGDAQASAQIAYAQLEKAAEQGSLSSFDLGTFTQQMSAVALVQIGEGRDQVFAPRLDTKARHNVATANMAIEQTIQTGHGVELGTRGHKRLFDIGKLEGEYEISYKYFPKSPTEDIARFIMADHASRWLSDEDIAKDILRREDPAGDRRRKLVDKASLLSPTVMRYEVIQALLDMAEAGDEDAEKKAKIMTAEIGMTIGQVMQGGIPQAETRPESMLPLLAPGGKSSAKKAAELQGLPRPEVGGE